MSLILLAPLALPQGVDAKWVKIDLTIETRKNKKDIIHWHYDGEDYEKYKSDFNEGTVKMTDGKSYECFYYQRKSTQIYCWTDQLRDLNPWKWKGKGR